MKIDGQRHLRQMLIETVKSRITCLEYSLDRSEDFAMCHFRLEMILRHLDGGCNAPSCYLLPDRFTRNRRTDLALDQTVD